jgi:predicted RNA binding protein YcfA (HicA-like mRNA interferase family)
MADLYRELIAILRANGCYLVRHGKGSHEIGTVRSISAP